MGPIHFKISLLGTLVLLVFAGGFPLWGHEGAHKKNPLVLYWCLYINFLWLSDQL